MLCFCIRVEQLKHKVRSNIAKDKHGRILFENDLICDHCKEYTIELYDREEAQNNNEFWKTDSVTGKGRIGPSFATLEFYNALRHIIIGTIN